jgi:Putative Flp pilus-assembly TadE/G-like
MNKWQWRREAGQALILVALAMPLFMSIAALVVDGTNLMVHRRQLQTAADGAALAASLELDPFLTETHASLTCDSTWASEKNNPSRKDHLVPVIEDYSRKNNGPDSMDGGSCRFDDARCSTASDSNCYTWPYRGNNSLVEVRLNESVSTFFTSAVDALVPGNPLATAFTASARAVSSAEPVTTTSVISGTTIAGFTDPDTTIPGGTHTTTDPDINLGGNGVAFTMSRSCSAIGYSGAGADNIPVGVFATNGGLAFGGFGNPKKVTGLFYDQTRCTANPSSPPSGTNQCTSTLWVPPDPASSVNLCVRTLVNLNQTNALPINWPITPPALPSIKTGPDASTYDPSTDYPGSCIGLGSSGTISITGNNWAANNPPGVYCVTGAGTTLKFGGGQAGADLSNGDGYTFFALDGASISTAGKTTVAKYYWPHQCDTNRPDTWPTDGRPASYVCTAFGRTLWTNYGYDPQTLYDATNPSADGSCAICLNGTGGDLTGDIFATKPDVFPPSLTDTGALVAVSGGALSAGKGFIQSWLLMLQGNTGAYRGNGSPIVIRGATHTTTDPSTTIFGQTHPGTTVPASTQTLTTGTTHGLDE